MLIVGCFRSSAGNAFTLDSVELGNNFAAGATPAPRIFMASVGARQLWVDGENITPGAVILLNGQEQRMKNDPQNPKSALIGKNAGKKVKAGDRVQVRNPNGSLSAEFTFSG